jgi:hypothetical protein
LIPLNKKDGGIRPIAVGDTLRRVVGKVLLRTGPLRAQVAKLAPKQCGVGVTSAADLVGMGLQRMVEKRESEGDDGFVVFQADFTNAFNCVGRDAVLRGAKDHAPASYNWLKWCYTGRAPCTARVGSSVRAGRVCTRGTPWGR